MTLFGIDGARAEAEHFSQIAIDLLEEMSEAKDMENPFLMELICQLVHREK